MSQVCARIQQATVIQDKDLRSFLDGIYVQDARLEYTDWFMLFKLIYVYLCCFCFFMLLNIIHVV